MLNKDDILSYYTDANNHLYQMIGYCPYPTVLMQNVRTGQVEHIVPDSVLAESYTKLVKEKTETQKIIFDEKGQTIIKEDDQCENQ